MRKLILIPIALAMGCATFGGERSTVETCYLASAAGTAAIEEAGSFLRSAQGNTLPYETREKVRLAMVSLDAALDTAAPICLGPDDGSGKIQVQIQAVQAAQGALTLFLTLAQDGSL